MHLGPGLGASDVGVSFVLFKMELILEGGSTGLNASKRDFFITEDLSTRTILRMKIGFSIMTPL
jgi:hypothetical protein